MSYASPARGTPCPSCLDRVPPRLAACVGRSPRLPAAAALYKWTDANGRVVYSDQPPTPSVKAETLNAPRARRRTPTRRRSSRRRTPRCASAQTERAETATKADKERIGEGASAPRNARSIASDDQAAVVEPGRDLPRQREGRAGARWTTARDARTHALEALRRTNCSSGATSQHHGTAAAAAVRAPTRRSAPTSSPGSPG